MPVQRGAAAAAWQRIRRDLPWWRRPLLASVVLAANRECNQREAARSGLISMLAAGRRIWLAIAGQMVETGGYLSHGAIVAREFALPAVVNLPGVLDLLQDGDEVEVDGLRGTVRRIGGSRRPAAG